MLVSHTLLKSIMAVFTSVFSVSGVFTDLWIVMLFCWHTQQRSDIGFITGRLPLEGTEGGVCSCFYPSLICWELILHQRSLLCTGQFTGCTCTLVCTSYVCVHVHTMSCGRVKWHNNLLGGAWREKLDVVLLVARNPPWKDCFSG